MPTSLQESARFLLALKSLTGVGIRGAHTLLAKFGSAASLFNASIDDLTEAQLKPAIINQIQRIDLSRFDPVIEWSEAARRHLVPWGTPGYPPLLAEIDAPPLLLFAIGDPELLLNPQIAIVGSRSPTNQGLHNTNEFCEALCGHGFTITSGMALGIDGEAHRAALQHGGLTIAVAATGLNRVYPANHRALAHQIAKKGLIISEYLPDAPQQSHQFPERNRIIAGLSLGTLVVEAAQKSGTLITARLAAESGREVFAIPGSIHNPLAKGCHRLIQQGAKLAQTIDDLLIELPTGLARPQASTNDNKRSSLDPATQHFLQCIDYEITTLDSILERSQLTVEAATNTLLKLELEGWIINSVGGYIRQ